MKKLFTKVNKVLPCIFDDSLSTIELLGRVTDKINEIIEEINNNFKSYFDAYISEIFIDSLYDEETETLTLFINKEGE